MAEFSPSRAKTGSACYGQQTKTRIYIDRARGGRSIICREVSIVRYVSIYSHWQHWGRSCYYLDSIRYNSNAAKKHFKCTSVLADLEGVVHRFRILRKFIFINLTKLGALLMIRSKPLNRRTWTQFENGDAVKNYE